MRAELATQWERDESGFNEQAERRARCVTTKAWHFFAGEMDEIASTFESAGLLNGFHATVGDVYHRLEQFKGAKKFVGLNEVLSALLE